MAFLESSSIDEILVIASRDLFDWYGGMAVIDLSPMFCTASIFFQFDLLILGPHAGAA